MMRAHRILFVATLAHFFCGCATPYQSTAFRGGYSETQLAPDVFRVYFRGNAFTSTERVQDLALLRAAEISRSHGFAYFADVDESTSRSVHTYSTPGQSYTSGSGIVTGNVLTYSEQTTYSPGQTFILYKPHSGLVIRCFAEKPQSGYVFDATFLEQSLRRKYGIE